MQQDWSGYTQLTKKKDDVDDFYGPKKNKPRAQIPGKVGTVGSLTAPKKKNRYKPLAFIEPTADELRAKFDALPESGTIQPGEVCFSQDSIGSYYTEPFKDNEGSVIESGFDHIHALKNGKIDPATTPQIRIAFVDGYIVTVDNRRLKVHKEAGKPIPYQKIDSIKGHEFKFTSKPGLTNTNMR